MVSSTYRNDIVCSHKLWLLATDWKARIKGILSVILSFIGVWWLSNMIKIFYMPTHYHPEVTFNWSASSFCLGKHLAGLPQEISRVPHHTATAENQGKWFCGTASDLGSADTPSASLSGICLETLLDCLQFQNNKVEVQAQSQTIHTENGRLSRYVTSSLHHLLVVSLLQLLAESPDNLHYFNFSCCLGNCKSACP